MTVELDSPRVSFFSMIADPVRHTILTCLLEEQICSVSRLIELTQKPQTLISYHLRCLKDCGLINNHKSEQDARQTLYSLHDEKFVKKIFLLADTYLQEHNECKNHSACQIKGN